jgi:hypothetical protein
MQRYCNWPPACASWELWSVIVLSRLRSARSCYKK